jgi:2-haloacid dehalogenase
VNNALIPKSGEHRSVPHLACRHVSAIKTYKPAPRAYQLGIDAFKLPKEQIAFAAFAGWDAAGAEWFGYPTFWVNRLNAMSEGLDEQKAAAGQGLSDLVRFVDEHNKQG